MRFQHPAIRYLIAIILIASCARTTWAKELKHPRKEPVSAVTAVSAPVGPLYATRPEVMQFADDLAARRNLDPAWVRSAIGQARYSATVARLMQPAAKPFVKLARLPQPLYRPDPHRRWREVLASQSGNLGEG